ncbi:indolepyruvate ferredoxin oxidoreductase subunit alpha [Anaerosporobacter sp.]|uniref:indolepyruvate ferredoxin oxidoreductase subunit alpha n=1 Tax=Anaerosporobacter sp. TaxID=1872529 RepID=UPI00286F045F|nr:ferredoxin family protein [Anaerosporobacter sp.]
MSIAINKNKCVGCKMCTSVCPGSLLALNDEQKAYIQYPKDCWGCASCVKECKFGAISLYLGADIGGRGSHLSTSFDGDFVTWLIEKPNGNKEEIVINRKESNRY